MANRLKFIGLYKLSTTKMVHSGSNDKSLSDSYNQEASKIIV